MKQRGWRLAVKRAGDVLMATTGILATSPVLAVAAGGVLVTMGRPVFFAQMRPGRGGEPFRLWKLRTMTNARGEDGKLLPDALRLTSLGRTLRALSIDELPQLWNVVRGEMSLVGPRPLLVQYLERYTPEQARRHEVLPGITGWAQICGRNALSWEEKFALDTWYVEHWSLALDARILLRTIASVLRREGISSQNHVTMPEFMGRKQIGLVSIEPVEDRRPGRP